MFVAIQEMFTSFIASIAQSVEAFTKSIEALRQDVDDIRSFFASIIGAFTSVFDFLGKEASILVLSTFLFLFILNFIPFLFFDKKVRYFLGIVFGVFIGVTYKYSVLGIAKYILAMCLPLILEVIIVFVLNKSKEICFKILKKTGGGIGGVTKKVIKKIIPQKKKEISDKDENNSKTNETGLK